MTLEQEELSTPKISKELIEYLERVFPRKSPTIEDLRKGQENIFTRACVGYGKRKVLEHLQSLYENQITNN